MHASTRCGQRTRSVQRIQLVKESRGLLLLTRHGSHQQAPTRSGDRHVEQPPLLHQPSRIQGLGVRLDGVLAGAAVAAVGEDEVGEVEDVAA